MRSIPVWLAVLALAAGCVEAPYGDESILPHPPYGTTGRKHATIESSYRSHLYDLDRTLRIVADPEGTRYTQLAEALETYAKDARYSVWKIIAGVPPLEREVGYLERYIYPPVILYNRDTGQFEKVEYEFNYVRDLQLSPTPRGIILGTGLTLLMGPAPGKEMVLGHYSLETASLLLLHVCPCCGVRVPDAVFHSVTRPDIDAERIARFKTSMVEEHTRMTEDYLPVQGLPGEFWRHPQGHHCYKAFEGQRDYGFDPMIPVRFEEVRASDLTAEKKGPQFQLPEAEAEE